MLSSEFIHSRYFQLSEFIKSLHALPCFTEEETKDLRSYLMSPQWHSSVVAEQDWGLLSVQGGCMDPQHRHRLDAY